MNRKYFYVILILVCISFFIMWIFFADQDTEEEGSLIQWEKPPFKHYIIGSGIVEPETGNISIGIPYDRIISDVKVSVNDHVKKGEILFELEHQDLLANLKVKKSEYEKALANLQRLEGLPRKEDLTAAEGALNKAQVSLDESQAQYQMVLNLPNPQALSQEERDKRLYRYQQAKAEFMEAQAVYEKIRSGTWQPELKVAFQEMQQAQDGIEAIEAEIQRMLIKSPIDGSVLQINIHQGETARSDPHKALMIIGNIDILYLRVSIDQLNAPLFHPDAPAVAFRQGDRSTDYPLKFIHVEPLIVPKKYLTNAISEKVDSQVLEVLYRITKKDSHLFIGEQMDVFIETENK